MTNDVRNFILYHKNVPVLRFAMRSWHVTDVLDVFNTEHAPVGTCDLHGVEWKKFLRWFEGRSIPASRVHLNELLDGTGLTDARELLQHNCALSLYDQYWIYPEGESAKWEDLNFFQNDFSEGWGDRLLGEGGPTGAYPDLFTPDNTSGGWLQKRWKIIDGKRYMYKGGSAPYRQEPANERVAALLCERLGVRHVNYELTRGRTGLPYSVCENYVSADTELVTAQQVSTLSRLRKNESFFEQYVRICREVGIENIEEELSRMIVVDYLLANRDRHWNNFGLVRNADDLSFMETFPIYDNGTSLWNDRAATDIRNEEIEGQMLRCSLEEHLRYVSDTSFLVIDELWPFAAEAEAVLSAEPFITGERAGIIAENLRGRIRYLDRWLSGGLYFIREGAAAYDADHPLRTVGGGPDGPVRELDDDAPGIFDGDLF